MKASLAILHAMARHTSTLPPPLLKRIEARGLLRRARDPADERQLNIADAEGPDPATKMAGIREALICRIEGNVEALRDALQALVRGLCKPTPVPGKRRG